MLPIAPARDVAVRAGLEPAQTRGNNPPRYRLRHLTMSRRGWIRTITLSRIRRTLFRLSYAPLLMMCSCQSSSWSRRRESNPRLHLGKVTCSPLHHAHATIQLFEHGREGSNPRLPGWSRPRSHYATPVRANEKSPLRREESPSTGDAEVISSRSLQSASGASTHRPYSGRAHRRPPRDRGAAFVLASVSASSLPHPLISAVMLRAGTPGSNEFFFRNVFAM